MKGTGIAEIPDRETRIEKNRDFIAREIAGEYLLVPIRRRPDDLEGLYTLNTVGGRIWQLIDGRRRIADIGAEIVREFEVGADEALDDTADFINRLKAIGAVEAV